MTSPSPDRLAQTEMVRPRGHLELARSESSLMQQVAKLTAELAGETARRILAEDATDAIRREVELRHDAFRAAELLAHLGSWSWQIGAEFITWSDQVHRIFGTDPNGAATKHETFVGMVHPDDRQDVLAVIRDAIRDGGPYLVEHRIVRPDGEVRHIRGRGRADLDPVSGHPVLLTGSVQDVTDLNAAAAELQSSRDLFAGVLHAATDLAIIATDADGQITVFNSGAEQMLGYSAAEMLGTSPERLHDPDEIAERAKVLGIPAGFEVFLTTAAQGAAETRQWTYVTKDGRRLQAMITVAAMLNYEGVVTGYIKIGTDVTDRVRNQAALQESESLFRDTFQNAPHGMMLVSLESDAPGRFLGVNPAMTDLTGYPESQLLEMRVSDLTHDDHLEAHRNRFANLARGCNLQGTAERHWVHADGHDLWVQFSVSSRRYGRQAYIVGQVQDITARKAAEAALTHQALHDWLTGLPNRVLLMDRIEHALAAGTRSGLQVGLLFLDLDGFKAVNDSAGHAAGDHTLVTVAERLSHAVRPGDTVARMGGDEFAVVCVELDGPATALRIAQRILAALSAPYSKGGREFRISASIGVCLSYPGAHPDDLLRAADDAMYGAKDAGKNAIRLSGSGDPRAVNTS